MSLPVYVCILSRTQRSGLRAVLAHWVAVHQWLLVGILLISIISLAAIHIARRIRHQHQRRLSHLIRKRKRQIQSELLSHRIRTLLVDFYNPSLSSMSVIAIFAVVLGIVGFRTGAAL